ncbi:hypothetical protein GX50_06152 [[Emmonsia] crescens]|uniref:Uncharacterized protein n=1 Tax=[Emmonsia] crescens TaxID=73230 RepID=A0A2B7ZDK3_9EURO|nr:hypothetical protein GX50_06152 [Emmonsia crescens]
MHARTRDSPLHTIFDLHSKFHARGLSINLYHIRRQMAFQETLMKRTETAVCRGKLQEDSGQAQIITKSLEISVLRE